MARRLVLTCAPGTLLSAGGNDVHAGPPTSSPRMFAFAVGVPADAGDAPFTDGDGEVQYNAVLFHLDLCCVLFGRCDAESKLFLLNRSGPLVSEHPDAESHSRQLGDARADLAGWLAARGALPTVDHAWGGRPRRSRSSAWRRRRGGRRAREAHVQCCAVLTPLLSV